MKPFRSTDNACAGLLTAAWGLPPATRSIAGAPYYGSSLEEVCMDKPLQVMTPTAQLHDFETPLYGGSRVLMLDESAWVWLTGLIEAAGHTVQWVKDAYRGDAEWGMRTPGSP